MDIHIGTDGIDGGEYKKYDPETGEYNAYRTSYIPCTFTERCGYLFKFKTHKEFLYKPVRLNGTILNNCTDKSSYELIGIDTVNIKDKYGMRQGIWLEYDVEDKLTNMDFYENDKLTTRYTFNKRGKTTSIKNYEIGIQRIKDTKKKKNYKELTKSPQKYRKK